MILSLPIIKTEEADIRRIGTVIHDLNTLVNNSLSIAIEPSFILDTGCFEEYQKKRILPDLIVQNCEKQFKKHNFNQMDMYLSVYKDCMMNITPITVSVSYSTLYNAIVSLYERWYDLKPRAKRTSLRLNPSDTYPAILFQPHRETELTTLTRHPKTGKLLQIRLLIFLEKSRI